MRKLLVLLPILCISLALQAFSQEPKIGVVYLRKAFEAYQKTIDYDKKLMEKRNELEKKLRDLKTEIEKLRASLEVLGEKEKAQKQQELREKLKAFNDARLEAMQSIDRERQKFMKDILSDVKAVIVEYAKKQSFDIILNGDMLLYSGDKYDITQDVIKILNEDYSKSKK